MTLENTIILEMGKEIQALQAELAKRDAEIAELKGNSIVRQVVGLNGILAAKRIECDALKVEVERLTAAAIAWCEVEKKL